MPATSIHILAIFFVLFAKIDFLPANSFMAGFLICDLFPVRVNGCVYLRNPNRT